jgi:asparagine synthase (glutamine-hydrolysing)
MCGICGVYEFDKDVRVEQSLIKKMCDVLIHRGPDEEGIYLDKNIGLGHRRLSIIDLSTGQQPLCNEDGSIWVVFNGEIYNYLELRKTLIQKGHILKTNCDTETIVHLYEEVGEDFVSQLRGMFSIAIWDSLKKRIILARDRLGKKPLYYFINEKRCLFGSELKAILQDVRVPREMDLEAMDDYFSFFCVPGEKSIFKGIQKLLPGHILICSQEKVEIKEYWDVVFDEQGKEGEKYYKEKLEKLLEDAVKCRLISEVPLGAFLSGGIDSSVVVSLMSRLLKEPVLTTTIGFEKKEFDESKFAKIVAMSCHTDHHELVIKPKAVEMLPRLIRYFDEPFADASAIPTYYVSKKAKEHITVALTGDGGDEVFGGYNEYRQVLFEHFISSFLPGFMKRDIIPFLLGCYPKQNNWRSFLFRGRDFLRSLSTPFEIFYLENKLRFQFEDKKSLYSHDLRSKIDGYNAISVLEPYFKRVQGMDVLTQMQYLDLKTYLPNDVLVKVDRMSMAVSLETRCPILDHKVVEFAFQEIPARLKLMHNQSKYILKKVMWDWFPAEIRNRRKKGFSVPIAHWIRGDLKPVVEEILFDQKSRQRGYFNFDYLQSRWKQVQEGQRGSMPKHFWALLIFELWCKVYLDGLTMDELKI